MNIKICCICNTNFKVTPSRFKTAKTCSRKCLNTLKNWKPHLIYSCDYCRKEFKLDACRIPVYSKHFCSRKCYWTAKKGIKMSAEVAKKMGESRTKSNNPRWNGGKYRDVRGYWFIMAKEHPRSNSMGYVKRSNLIAEKAVGRILEKGEVIHHIDHNKENDFLDNLYLFSSHSEHMRHHAKKDILISNLI